MGIMHSSLDRCLFLLPISIHVYLFMRITIFIKIIISLLPDMMNQLEYNFLTG